VGEQTNKPLAVNSTTIFTCSKKGDHHVKKNKFKKKNALSFPDSVGTVQ